MSAWQIFLVFGVAIATIVGAIVGFYWKIVDKVDEKLKDSDKAAQEREKERAKLEAEARKDVSDKLKEAERLAQERDRTASQERTELARKLEGYIAQLAAIASSLENYKDVKEFCFNRFTEIESDIVSLKKEQDAINGRLNGHIGGVNRHSGK
ncbi:MAG: hypothetical protein PHI12_07375 [Dehalococcoidales bacterium]|nr:hypothetical protein [Dehalococcoidales bacterium]